MKKIENRKSKIEIIIIIFVLLICPGASAYARATIETLSQVEKLFMQEKYDRVISEAGRLIDTGAHGREELFYLKGLSQLQLGRFSAARETFEYMIERYPQGKRTFDGYIGIGDSYYLEGKFNEAVTGYNNALNNHPDHKNASTVHYKLANAYQKLGMGDKAKDYFDKVRDKSPLSFESKIIPKDVADGYANFYVQAGYFKSRANAEKLTRKLRQKGYDGYMSTHTKAGITFYRVKVGNFKSAAEAEALAKRLKADGYKTKVCR